MMLYALCTGSRQLTDGNGERVKRRLDPFPNDFMFEFTAKEFQNWGHNL